MTIDALKVVFGDMLDSRVAPGKQLKKDIKVDRRTTVSLFLKTGTLIISERLLKKRQNYFKDSIFSTKNRMA